MKRAGVQSRAGVIEAKVSDIDAVETVIEYAETKKDSKRAITITQPF